MSRSLVCGWPRATRNRGGWRIREGRGRRDRCGGHPRGGHTTWSATRSTHAGSLESLEEWRARATARDFVKIFWPWGGVKQKEKKTVNDDLFASNIKIHNRLEAQVQHCFREYPFSWKRSLIAVVPCMHLIQRDILWNGFNIRNATSNCRRCKLRWELEYGFLYSFGAWKYCSSAHATVKRLTTHFNKL